MTFGQDFVIINLLILQQVFTRGERDMQERFHDFTVLIGTIGRYIRKIKTEEMAEFELKSPHVSCLYYLYKMEKLTAKELCDVCQEDKAATSRSIEFLETNGYIYCLSSAKKRYKSPFTLTGKGKDIGGKIAQKIDGILELAGANVSNEHRAILYQSLRVIAQNLQNICEEYHD